MKFKIFGDLDAPDWILREVVALSKLVRGRDQQRISTFFSQQSAVRLRLLVDQIVSKLMGNQVNVRTLNGNLVSLSSPSRRCTTVPSFALAAQLPMC